MTMEDMKIDVLDAGSNLAKLASVVMGLGTFFFAGVGLAWVAVFCVVQSWSRWASGEWNSEWLAREFPVNEIVWTLIAAIVTITMVLLSCWLEYTKDKFERARSKREDEEREEARARKREEEEIRREEVHRDAVRIAAGRAHVKAIRDGLDAY